MSTQGVIGHKKVLSHLEQIHKGGRVPHAILFSGPEGVGKYAAARSFAKELLGLKSNDLKSCADFHLVTPAFSPKTGAKKDIPVESIRELCSKLRLKPFSGNKVVCIINDAERLSISAANALLTTLEEPSSTSHLILLTKAENKLPETIVSRTQRFHFGFLSHEELASLLQELTSGDLDKQSLDFLCEVSQGSLGLFQLRDFLDESGAQVIDPEGLRDYLQGFSQSQKKLYSELDKLFVNDVAYALALAAKYANEGDSRFWPGLKTLIKKKLLDPQSKDFNKLSMLYAETLEAERLIVERHLSQATKISELFIKFPNT